MKTRLYAIIKPLYNKSLKFPVYFQFFLFIFCFFYQFKQFKQRIRKREYEEEMQMKVIKDGFAYLSCKKEGITSRHSFK